MLFSFPDEKVEEFRQLYEHYYEQPCTLEEAKVMLQNMIELYDLLSEVAMKQARQDQRPE